ncbi:hypothetical protein MAHJHV59_47690 [Mycobacterium avium subsp. hominissuis]
MLSSEMLTRSSPARASPAARAGLDRVNISLDSMDREHFATITRRDRLADVLAGLAAAIGARRPAASVR